MNEWKYVNRTGLQEGGMLQLLGLLTSILRYLSPSRNDVFLCPFEGGVATWLGQVRWVAALKAHSKNEVWIFLLATKIYVNYIYFLFLSFNTHKVHHS